MRNVLTTYGALDLDVYSPELIASWNKRLDPLLESRDSDARSYVGASELHDLGIFGEQFTPNLLASFETLQEHPVLYHCHVYETAGEQTKPHIGSHNLNGWHRDIETLGVFPTDPLAFLSVFTLLSDVNDGDGAFEIVPRYPERIPNNGEPCVQMTGQAGRTLMWNRSFFHRASPNSGTRRRRILKLSIQPARLPNDRLGLNEFTSIDGVGPELRSLLGAGHRFAQAALPNFNTPTPRGEVKLTTAGRVSYRVIQTARSLRK